MITRESRWTLCTVILLALMVMLGTGCQQKEKPAPSGSGQTLARDEGASITESVPGVSPVSPVDIGAPDAVAQRLCNALHTLPQTRKAQCCGTTPSSSLASECVRTLSTALRDQAVTLNPGDVDRCVEESSRQLEGCDWVTPLMPRSPETCRNLVHGQLQAGARCRSLLECRDGLFCRGNGPTQTGVCVEPGVVGATCTGFVDTLVTYTRQIDYETRHPECVGFCRAGRCAAFVAVGGACSSSKQCGPGHHCVSGRCVDGPLPNIGEACSGTSCAVGVCVEGKCVALKAAGEPCTSPFECQAACVKPAGAEVGTCGIQCSNWPPAGYPSPSTSLLQEYPEKGPKPRG